MVVNVLLRKRAAAPRDGRAMIALCQCVVAPVQHVTSAHPRTHVPAFRVGRVTVVSPHSVCRNANMGVFASRRIRAAARMAGSTPTAPRQYAPRRVETGGTALRQTLAPVQPTGRVSTVELHTARRNA
eukprot:INCI14711.7.p2 GENE.INCI14711.7~~INCI14711.7.p2  ORF type:complete len:128 (-),score=3.71 INCI14711.7:351-734(-)